VDVPGAGRSFDRWLSSDGFGISLQWRTSDDKRERSASPESLPPLHYALLLKEGLLKRASASHGNKRKDYERRSPLGTAPFDIEERYCILILIDWVLGGSQGWAFGGRVQMILFEIT